MKKLKRNKLLARLTGLAWPLVIISLIFLTVYAVAHQILRSGANDPQIQMARDLGRQVTGDKLPNAADTGNIDIGSSLAPFVVVYNKDGDPVAGTGYLRGQLPRIPKGALTAAKNKPDSRVTWAPAKGVRIAAVTVATNDHYLMAGRSLKEVDSRLQKVFKLTVLGWLLTVAALVIYKRQAAGRKK